MPFRFFVPLPGPFVYVRKSKAERDLERQQRQVAAAQRADMSMVDHYRRAMFFVVGFWALMTWVAIYNSAWWWAVGIAALGCVHVGRAIELEQRRRAAEAAPPNEGTP